MLLHVYNNLFLKYFFLNVCREHITITAHLIKFLDPLTHFISPFYSDNLTDQMDQIDSNIAIQFFASITPFLLTIS